MILEAEPSARGRLGKLPLGDRPTKEPLPWRLFRIAVCVQRYLPAQGRVQDAQPHAWPSASSGQVASSASLWGFLFSTLKGTARFQGPFSL